MAEDESPALTARQRQVMERIDRRVPIKAIAAELSLSETRINQHISALKQAFHANSLVELTGKYRVSRIAATAAEDPLRKPACNVRQVPGRDTTRHQLARVANGELVLADAQFLPNEAPWSRTSEPSVVPGMLDGSHAVLRRLGAMLLIAFAVIAMIILSVSAAKSVGDLMDDVAQVPAEKLDAAD
ncbi:MAG: LuxR C-terminal-related transcriptional regulator [Croceibacterium sp.]